MKLLRNAHLLSMIFIASAGMAQINTSTSFELLTKKLILIKGYSSMEYKYMEFVSVKGDTIYSNVFDTCFTPKGYVELWDSGGPPSKISPLFMNDKFNVTFYYDSITSPNDMGRSIKGITIRKMELTE